MSNSQATMSNENQNIKSVKKYDLEERTAKFGEEIIDFVKSLDLAYHLKSICSQLVRSSTSVGANYCEADCAESRKDFRHKISLCKKEAKESKHWLRMLAKACPQSKIHAQKLWREANELQLIFITIVRNTDD